MGDIDEAAVIYNPITIKESSTKAVSSALKHLLAYLGSSKHIKQTIESLTIEDTNQMSFWGSFATYLLTLKLSGENEYYSSGSILQYFSVSKNSFARKWADKPECVLKIDEKFNPLWYTEQYHALKDQLAVLALEREIGDPSQGAIHTTKTYEECCRWLLSHPFGQTDGAFTSRVGDRLALVLDYNACGRSSELSYISWLTVCERLGMQWSQLKVSTTARLEFFSFWGGYLMCPRHASACSLLFPQPGSNDNSFILPSYANLAIGGAANKLSNVLKAASTTVKELKRDHTSSHSIRRTAFNVMAASPLLSFWQVVSRSGHGSAADAMTAFYLWKHLHQAVAGKIIAGVHDPTKEAPCPNLDVVRTTPALTLQLENFTSMLFVVPCDSFKVTGHNRELLDTFTASLLQYYPAMIKDFGKQHKIVRKITDDAKRCGIDFNALMNMSDLVDKDFERQKIENMMGSNIELNALVKEVTLSRNEITRLARVVEMNVDQTSNLERMMTAMYVASQQQRSPGRPASSPTAPIESTAASGPEDSKASSTSAQPNSNSSNASTSAQPNSNSPNALSMMMAASKTHVPISFSGALSWSLTKLIKEVGSQGIRFDADGRPTNIDGCDSKNERSVATIMIMHMMGHATAAQKSALAERINPATESVASKLESQQSVAVALENTTLALLLTRENVYAQALIDNAKKKRKRKTTNTVGSVLRRIQKVTKQEAGEKVVDSDDDE